MSPYSVSFRLVIRTLGGKRMYANPFRRGFVSFGGALPPIVFPMSGPRKYTINATCHKSTPEIRLYPLENAAHVSAVVIIFRRQD